jgi:redox-sensing transcriptional repressor
VSRSVLPPRGRGRSGQVPAATVARLPGYLRTLAGLAEDGVETVSSDELASAAGVTSAKVRKDLSHLGSWGTRGVGYDVAALVEHIGRELGLSQRRGVVIVGIGNLGRALAGYGGFASRGFKVAGLIDADQQRQGEMVHGMRVRPYDHMAEIIETEDVRFGVISVPAEAAQDVADAMVAAGITAILNFAPIVLTVPDGVDVRRVDLATELQILSFLEARKDSEATARRSLTEQDLDEVASSLGVAVRTPLVPVTP